MSHSSLLLNWFLVSVLLSVMAMKLSSLKVSPRLVSPLKFIFLSPVFSVTSWNKRVPASRAIVKRKLMQTLALSIPFVISGWIYLRLISRPNPGIFVQYYVALIPIYCMGQFASSLLELVYLPTGWVFPAHFNFPVLSSSLAEFWGWRWATFVSDWLRQMVLLPFRQRPTMGLLVAFLISGLWHELLINVPLYLYYQVNLLGSMMIYFTLQAAAILLERKIFSHHPRMRRLFTWIIVVFPAPLVMNEGILRALGLFK